MILTQDRVLGETMMHLVPTCSPQPPTFDVSSLEFDLDLLPLTDCQVPSPSSSLSPLDCLPVSPTMFSPDSKEWVQNQSSPSPSYSPYSPAGRGERRTSSLSQDTITPGTDVRNINLQESILEFTQLQDKIKQEQELLLDTACSQPLPLDSGISGPPSYSQLPSLTSPGLSYHAVPNLSSHEDQIKMEPLDFLERSSLLQTVPSQSQTNTHQQQLQQNQSNNALLKQCLQDTSFQTKYNLKPFNFGETSGFVSDQRDRVVLKSESSEVGKSGETIKLEPQAPQDDVTTAEDTLSDVKIEPVLDLAVEQVRKDIETTCEMLSISSDPRRWSKEDVKSWLFWTLQLYHIPMSMINMELWNMDGNMIVSLPEEDFKQRLPEGAEMMYAQFDIWRSNAQAMDSFSGFGAQRCANPVSQQQVPRYAPPPYPEYGSWPSSGHQQGCSSSNVSASQTHVQPQSQNTCNLEEPSFSDISYMLQMLDHQNNPPEAPNPYLVPKTEPESNPTVPLGPGMSSPPPPYTGAHTPTHSDHMEEDEDEEDEESEMPHSKSPGSSRPGTNIHLWQFVKELLLQPQLYGNYIHWIDRSKGVFKIVDSVKVATLWGKRKNRPAMNYDKLSRSLRQYYKKGIMKKTERSQRLVYQFCHPYHL